MPGDDDENREELDYDEFDEAQDFDVERCGDATELNFIELARQCERHEFTEWKKRGQRHSMNYRFAERFYACAARKARNEGRTSPHAAVGLQSVYRSKELPADEEWKREQAEDAVASLTDGVTSVSERWRAARDLARARSFPPFSPPPPHPPPTTTTTTTTTTTQQTPTTTTTTSSAPPAGTGMCVLLNNTSQRTVIGAVTLDVEEVRQTSLAEVYGRQICAMDCVDLESCDDSALYFLEFSRVDNHYRLLHAISRQLDGALIVDLGTHGGGSSFALASNGRNRVVSFDLDPVHLSNHAHSCGQTRENFTKRLPNVRYVVGDALELEPALLLQAALVVLDTAHDGVWEAKLLAYLMDGGFQGLVLLDDIHANMAMELLWAGIALPKWDVTHMGHALSGTGIVDFSGNGAAAAAPAGAQS